MEPGTSQPQVTSRSLPPTRAEQAQPSVTLRSLAANIPADGPRIDAFPELPPGAPSWNGRVALVPKNANWDYNQVTNALTEGCREGRTVNIYCNAVVSNRDRDDGKQIGATSAVLYHEGRELQHAEEVLGESVTEADAHTRALTPGLNALTVFLATRPVQQHALIILLVPSNPALNKMLNASPHDEQAASIRHLKKLGELLSTYPHTQVRLQWLPTKVPFIGFLRARQLAFEAIRTAILTGPHEPPSIKKQKEATKRAAIAKWENRYYNNPRTSLAFQTALRSPPEGKTHHTFNIKPTPQRGHNGAESDEHARDQEATKAKFSRLTHSTLIRFITGHAFTGEYTKRFYPHHTQEQIACSCGEPIQTVEHVLTECPLYTSARRKHLTANGRPRTLPQLFANSKRVEEVLRFLEETGACAKPRARWEPG